MRGVPLECDDLVNSLQRIFCAKRGPNVEISLRNLCVLCISVVKENENTCKRRGAEDTEITQS